MHTKNREAVTDDLSNRLKMVPRHEGHCTTDVTSKIAVFQEMAGGDLVAIGLTLTWVIDSSPEPLDKDQYSSTKVYCERFSLAAGDKCCPFWVCGHLNN